MQLHDGALDDDELVAMMARSVLGGPRDEGRSNYQIAINVCGIQRAMYVGFQGSRSAQLYRRGTPCGDLTTGQLLREVLRRAPVNVGASMVREAHVEYVRAIDAA